MTDRFPFIDGSVVWHQDNMDNSTLTDTINESYATAEGDSPTRYLSVLDTTTDMSLDNLNITLSNPKLEIEDSAESYATEEGVEQPEDGGDQVVVFSVEGSDELYGIQIMQDEEGNLQKYQFQFRKNDDGQLEAIPETITLIPMEDEPSENVEEPLEQESEYATPIDEVPVHVFVQEDEHILPDNIEQQVQEMEEEEEETNTYDSETVEEDTVDIKPGLLQLHNVNVKQEIHESQSEYAAPDLIESHESFVENIENQQISDFENLPESIEEGEEQETNFEYEATNVADHDSQSGENSMSSEYQEKDQTEAAENCEPVAAEEQEDFEQLEENDNLPSPQAIEDLQAEEEEEEEGEEEEENEAFHAEPPMNDSDENDYEIVEGIHITGDVDSTEEEHVEKYPTSNILRHALKTNKDSSKIVKKDNKLYLYVVQHPEKENVDSLSLEMSNLCRPRVNPRSILKSSHAMFPSTNEIDNNSGQDERSNKRFARCKEAMQAMLFHNFINKTTIPQAPVRKIRLPRKQKIKPVERMDEEIVVQEVMVSSNGFVEAVNAGLNKENLAVTEYVELTDSDDDYDPKKINRKRRKHRREKKRIEITISDDSDASDDSVIELDESDDEINIEERKHCNNNSTPPKRRRGRPPKSKSEEYPSNMTESPAKKSRVEEPIENPPKPEIPCPKCNKTFPSQNSLKTHLQYHNLQSSIKRALPEYKYKCENCATTFINNILLKKHMCSKLFTCLVCKKKFPDLSSLNGHKRTHAKQQMVKNTAVAQVSPKKLKPVQPTNTFKVPTTFKAPNLSNFKCKTCGKLCSSMQTLNIHIKSHKEFICITCSKSFLSQLLLEKHVRENCVKSPQHNRRSTRIKSVGDAEKAAENSQRLRTRSLTNLTRKSPRGANLSGVKVKCDLCSMQFTNFQALFKHKVVKHGLETPDKTVLEQGKVKTTCRGVPAATKLQNVFVELKRKLEFSD